MRHYILSITLFAGMTSLAFGQDESKIEGQIFLVTKKAENIRLGGIEVRVYSADAIREHILKRQERIKAEMPDFDAHIASQNGTNATRKQNIAKLKALGDTNTDFSRFLAKDLKDGEERLESIKLEKASWPTAQHYFMGLPDTNLSVYTDADGKFVISILEKMNLVLDAHAQRETYSAFEHYYWLIQIPADSPAKKFVLSNHNLVTTDSKASVLHTKSAWSGWSKP